MKKAFRLQSAMEYLMTYGWAILIIAVVLGALFQLGVFNSSSFSPRAPPGACQVFRPNGPGTTTNINLMGVCTGQLPQYVAQFNGQNGYVDAGNGISLNVLNAITVVVWIRTSDTKAVQFIGGHGNSGVNGWNMFVISGTSVQFRVGNGTATVAPSMSYSKGPWTFITATYDGFNVITYVNGVAGTPLTVLKPIDYTSVTNTWIGQIQGSGGSSGRYFNGSISNMQIYNTSLSTNQIQALYLEGIGGAPSKLQNLVGWWPLNGNSNDYSGNNNNGVPTNVVFTSQYGK